MLEDVLQSYRELGEPSDWKHKDINQMFFECIEHENQPDSEVWYAGLVCRLWGYVAVLYTDKNKGNVPFEECYNIIIDAIDYVLVNRVWEKPESSIYNDPRGPEKAFHMSMKRSNDKWMKSSNAKKRSANFKPLSLDGFKEEYKDASEGLLDIGDTSSEDETENINLIEYIKTKEPEQIILLDQVCFNNWGNLNNVITNIRKLTNNDYGYYKDRYNLDEKQFTKTLRNISRVSRNTIMSELKKVLYMTGKEILSE